MLLLKTKQVCDTIVSVQKSCFFPWEEVENCSKRNEAQSSMNFTEIAENRQSCRKYDAARMVESEKLARVLESARLAPSACNGQPYLIPG